MMLLLVILLLPQLWLYVHCNRFQKKQYTFNGVKVEAIDKEKDLGVINITSLSWNDHIKQCISKSNDSIGHTLYYF